MIRNSYRYELALSLSKGYHYRLEVKRLNCKINKIVNKL